MTRIWSLLLLAALLAAPLAGAAEESEPAVEGGLSSPEAEDGLSSPAVEEGISSPAAEEAPRPPAPPAPAGGDPLFDDDFDLELGEGASFPDPLEPLNRPILRFNQELDRWILDPVTRLYRFLLPGFVRTGIANVFINLDAPPVFVNDLLQLEWKDAGFTLSRFTVNTTLGIGGFFEVAESVGLPPHQSDFGQTLAIARIPSGPYLVLPVIGPSNIRDGFGEIVDAFLRPTTYIFPLFSTQQLFYSGGLGLTVREQYFEEMKVLKEGSVDYYAVLRTAFYQNRQAQIWDRRDHRRGDWDLEPREESPPQEQEALPEADPELAISR